MKIIIVEDNLIQRELLEMYVRKLGHEIVGLFDNGESLLEFLDNNLKRALYKNGCLLKTQNNFLNIIKEG